MILIATIFFIIFPLFSIPFSVIGMICDKKHRLIYSIFFMVCISILLYYLIPDTDMDLYRYYKEMNIIRNQSFSTYINYIFNNAEPLSKLMLFFFSKIGDNSLMIVFVTIVSYSIIFYILFDYMKCKKNTRLDESVIILYALLTFLIMYNIGGIRLCLARLLFFLALYLDFFKGKKNMFVYLLYIIPFLIHTSTIILLLIRLLLFFTKGKFGIKELIIIILLALSPNALILIATNFSIFKPLSTLTSRSEIYLSGTYSNMSNIYLLQITLLIVMTVSALILKFKYENYNKKFLNFSLMTLCVAILFLNNSSIATRFIMISTTNSLILNQDLMESLKPKNKILFSTVLLAIGLVYLTYQIISLEDVAGYGKLFNEKLFSTIFTIFIK